MQHAYWLISKRFRLGWNGLLLAKKSDAPNASPGGDTLCNSLNATISF